MNPLFIVVIILVLWMFSCINILNEYERGVIFRLGRLNPKPVGPGLIFVWKPIDRIVKLSLRVETLDVPSQDVVTRDNVTVDRKSVV